MNKILAIKFAGLIAIFFCLLCLSFGPAAGAMLPLTDNSKPLFDIKCDFQECVSSLGNTFTADYGYYMRGGLLLNNIGGIQNLHSDNPDLWIFRLWPPGMPLLFSSLFGLVNDSGYFLVSYLVLVVAVWQFVFSLLLTSTKTITSALLSLGGIFVFLLSPMFRLMVFGNSIFYSEALSLGIFALSIIFFIRSYSSKFSLKISVTFSLLSGLFMGIAAYLRSVFDGIGIATCILFACIIILVALRAMFDLFFQKIRSRTHTNSQEILKLLFWIMPFAVITFPWRLMVLTVVSPGNFSFAPATNIAWANGWIPTSSWEDKNFPINFGINGFCQAFTAKCSEIARTEQISGSPYSGYGGYTSEDFKNIALSEIFKNPWNWLSSRIEIGTTQALASFETDLLGQVFLIASILLFLGLTATLVFSLWSKKFSSTFSTLIITFWASMSVAPLFLFSFEPRYFFPAYVSLWVLGISYLGGRLMSEEQVLLRNLIRNLVREKSPKNKLIQLPRSR